jgi:hypothetical protein
MFVLRTPLYLSLRARNTKKNMACHFIILLAGQISYGLSSMYFHLPSLKFSLPFCHWQSTIQALSLKGCLSTQV